ncbi:MAG: glycosyltransferase family 61 protein [Bacteroidales bacterium]|nr:glycosyltransferase family 61 protein [Bacteroidales bacterium]MDT8431506.1 glycosyltransferase family 61 protein [Bacteroidales bacterium]
MKVFSKRKRNQRNQYSVVHLANSTREIALNPIPPGSAGGNIDHYYHFIFDLLLPLSLIIRKTPSDVIFLLQETGILTPILLKLFGSRVRIQHNFETIPEEKMVDLMGLNPLKTSIQHFPYHYLKELICDKYCIVPTNAPNKILLIERAPPDPYYLDVSKSKGSGSSRRSIRNHKELEECIRSKIAPGYEFHNLQLENMPFEEQVRYFDSAVAVIGQHGAGLANIIWMPQQSIVIEFGFQSKKHFKKLSASLKHQYFLFDYKESHIEVNCETFTSWLSKNRTTRHVFSKQP